MQKKKYSTLLDANWTKHELEEFWYLQKIYFSINEIINQ